MVNMLAFLKASTNRLSEVFFQLCNKLSFIHLSPEAEIHLSPSSLKTSQKETVTML